MEPRLFGLLISKCSSPTASGYKENLAKCLSRASTGLKKPLNEPAAKYAIDAARHFEFLTETLHWSWRAQVINLVTDPTALDPRASLSRLERAAYAKYYFESDGAVLLRLLVTIFDRGSLAWTEVTDTSLMEDVFREALKDYLEATTDIRDRTEIRQSLRQLDAAAKAKTRKHKAAFHFEALMAFDLVERSTEANGHVYRLVDRAIVADLTKHLPARSLDSVMRDEGGWPLIRAMYPTSRSAKPKGALPLVAAAYRRIMATGLQVCPLAAVVDFVVASGLATTPSTFYSPSDIVAELKDAKSLHPDAIRFHVDRTGKPAYLLLGDEALSSFEGHSD